MLNKPAFTVIIALSLIRNAQIKNKKDPMFNNQMLSGSYISAVARAPSNVTNVAIHLILFDNEFLNIILSQHHEKHCD